MRRGHEYRSKRKEEVTRYQYNQGRYKNTQRRYRTQKWAEDRAVITERIDSDQLFAKEFQEAEAQTEALDRDNVRIEQLSQELVKKNKTVRRYLVTLYER